MPSEAQNVHKSAAFVHLILQGTNNDPGTVSQAAQV